MQEISVFGATGTIGDNVLDLVAQYPDRFRPKILTAHKNTAKLAALAQRWQPDMLVLVEARDADDLRAALPDFSGEILSGSEALLAAAQVPVDLAVMAIVGFAALAPTLELARQGRRIVLANKECLVAGGDLLMSMAATHGAKILPADSEHNAIFQLLQGQEMAAVEKIILTASGGPCRTTPIAELAHVTPAIARAHPNWDMGAKISVDSATLMNKGLELIEAKHLFDLPADAFDVLVHPQSIVHGLIYFSDGSVLAQKAMPDMRTPLAHCLAYPARLDVGVPKLDLAAIGRLDFEQPDREKFPCLALCEAAMREGGLAPTILNAANEVAVAAFLAKKIGFTDIAALVAYVVDEQATHRTATHVPDLAHIIACDAAARKAAQDAITQVL